MGAAVVAWREEGVWSLSIELPSALVDCRVILVVVQGRLFSRVTISGYWNKAINLMRFQYSQHNFLMKAMKGEGVAEEA